MRPIYISEKIIAETLYHLREAGKKRVECVVLWLANDDNTGLIVEQVYRPMQMAAADIFRLPPQSMQAIMDVLAEKELMIAAQVHSHPREAFHSRADDEWAIVRHADALSLVVPDFAMKTDVSSFYADTKIFKLSSANKWLELPEYEVSEWLK